MGSPACNRRTPVLTTAPPSPQERRGLHWLPTTIGLLVLSWSLWLAIFWLVALNLYQVPRWWDEPLARWLDLLLVCTCVHHRRVADRSIEDTRVVLCHVD